MRYCQNNRGACVSIVMEFSSRFPFILNRFILSLPYVELYNCTICGRQQLHFYLRVTGVVIMPSYENTQLAGDSSIVKLPYEVVPLHKYLQLFKYKLINCTIIIVEIKYETQPSHSFQSEVQMNTFSASVPASPMNKVY